jgi:hypothetical protein
LFHRGWAESSIVVIRIRVDRDAPLLTLLACFTHSCSSLVRSMIVLSQDLCDERLSFSIMAAKERL